MNVCVFESLVVTTNLFSMQPKDKKSVSEKAFRPVEKDLVFDIDMTDYDDIRTCCSGGNICHDCWQFMTIAIKVIDKCLRGKSDGYVDGYVHQEVD
jgi:DNA primase catalytic subunit